MGSGSKRRHGQKRYGKKFRKAKREVDDAREANQTPSSAERDFAQGMKNFWKQLEEACDKLEKKKKDSGDSQE